MNERIKKLMLEAGYAAPEIALRAQKLSELIVRECADCSYHMARDSGPITADLIKIRIMSMSGVK